MEANQQTRVLYCDCAHAEIIPPRVKQEVLRQLDAAGVAFEAIADMCELSAKNDPRLKRIAESGSVRIAACHPRAVRWLFHAAGAPLPDERVNICNMREQSAEQVVVALLSDPPPAQACACQKPRAELKPGDWMPWFPVIDYDRCTNCKQCLSFCLFGVFGLDADDRVEVRKPASCKTGCPACARVCPSVAIIFPKYDKPPVNGDVVREEDVQHAAVKVDVSALVDRDVHASLRTRGKQARTRFSTARKASGASQGQRQDLKKLQAELDIPDDVMRSLPGTCGDTCEGECDEARAAVQASVPVPAPASAPVSAPVCDCDCTYDADGNCVCDCDCTPDADGNCECACDCADGSAAGECGPPDAEHRECCNPSEQPPPSSLQQEWDI